MSLRINNPYDTECQIKENSCYDNVFVEDSIPRFGGRVFENATTMFVTISSYARRVPLGSIQTLYYQELIPFAGFGQLVLIMDDIMEQVGFPLSGNERRSFYGNQDSNIYFDTSDLTPIETMEEIQSIMLPKGKYVFSIRVNLRQHSSMQGVIRLVGSHLPTMYFRSELEMIRMMTEIMTDKK